ncbi:MAG TPA: serine/threonine-protein kinase [Enhygromyxa sp.]|nr:serine/threonine-protein kinase [Enhygromyxa sp.]
MAVATPSSRELFTARASTDDPDTPNKIGGCDDEDTSVLEPGVYVDRYRILEVVGTGGIGVVYAAADEALGRKIAIKLLRPSARSSVKLERRRARLIREAQALARLSHPNVVPIYEVGMFEDRVFLAMEFVEGLTMRRWLRRSQRSWEEILDKYVQAGRGLAAAHAADIVHRDFKPENVLVGHDGRVRVLDFGLATPVPDAIATGRFPTIEEQQLALERTGRVRIDDPRRKRPPTAPNLSSREGLTESAAALITAHGKVMGTPAYMSPEQSRGEPIDARADQYSFCVALWEALCGERPHGPLSATARIRGHRRTPERTQDRLRHLERGLSLDPRDRFPDMASLLAVLERRPSQWRRWLLLGGLPLAAGLAITIGVIAPTMAEPCPRDEAELDGIWDAQVRIRAHQRLTAANRPYADATWDTIEQELDRWTNGWLDSRVEACEATKVRHEQSSVLLDMRMACLDRQANALRAVTESLASDPIDPFDPINPTNPIRDNVDARLEAALAAVLNLPDPSRCGRAVLASSGLADELPLDGPLEQQRFKLARARGLLDIAKHEEALALVDEVVRELEDSRPEEPGVAQVGAEIKLIRGRILAAAGRVAEADTELRAAVFAAQTAGHDEVTVEACAALVDLLQAQGKLDDAEDWAALGRATLARFGGDPHLEATLRFATARLARERGEFDLALTDQLRVLELREQLYGPDHVEIATILSELVLTKERLGRFEEAELDITRALTIFNHELGFSHPERGLALSRFASLQHARGRDREALLNYFDVLAIFELAYGETHPHIAMTLNNIAVAHDSLGEHEDALRALQRSHAILLELHGEEHPKVSSALLNIATVLHELGRDDEALEHFERAEQIIGKTVGFGHVSSAFVRYNRGGVHVAQGRYDDALAEFRKAHAIWLASVDPGNQVLGLVLGAIAKVEHLRGETEAALGLQREALAHREAALGEDHPDLALHLTWIGVGLVALDRHDEAREPLERAIALIDRSGRSEPELLGTARLALAEVVWRSDGPRTRQAQARELARAAIEDFEQLGDRPSGIAELDRAKTWLRQHGG